MPKKNWTIRKTSVSDAEALTECMHAAYVIYNSRLMGKTLPPINVNYDLPIP
jgi:hypothetical protein